MLDKVSVGVVGATVARAGANPLITIGIPTYNRVSLLKGCVESALAQSYPNIEVIVSDNASTDDTLAFLQSIVTRGSAF